MPREKSKILKSNNYFIIQAKLGLKNIYNNIYILIINNVHLWFLSPNFLQHLGV